MTAAHTLPTRMMHVQGWYPSQMSKAQGRKEACHPSSSMETDVIISWLGYSIPFIELRSWGNIRRTSILPKEVNY
jgi:hypothetical protein